MAVTRQKRGQGVDRSGRSKREGQHIRLYAWMTRSEAWQSSPAVERAVLTEIYGLYNGANNGEVYLSVREAGRRVGVGRTRAAEALRNLVERGFIRPCQLGAFLWKTRKATCWILTEFPFAGQPPTKDFMRWRQAGENNTRSARTDVLVPPADSAARLG